MYSDEVEPIPATPAELDTRPLWVALAAGAAIALGVLAVTGTAWGSLALVPLLLVEAWTLVRMVVRYRRYMRELDAWEQRMTAWYEGQINSVRERRRADPRLN